jgi:hypothetical protein
MPSTTRTATTYGWQHRRARAAAVRQALGTPCPARWSAKCDGIMRVPSRMHYDHTHPVALGGTKADRIICMPCNTGMGAALGNAMRGARRHGSTLRTGSTRTRALPTW